MTPPMTPPRDNALVPSPKCINGQIIPKEKKGEIAPFAPNVDRRSNEQKRKDMQASQAFQSLYLSPDH